MNQRTLSFCVTLSTLYKRLYGCRDNTYQEMMMMQYTQTKKIVGCNSYRLLHLYICVCVYETSHSVLCCCFRPFRLVAGFITNELHVLILCNIPTVAHLKNPCAFVQKKEVKQNEQTKRFAK